MSNWHGGKGSKQRTTNTQKFNDNYDAIFSKKPKVRKSTPDHGSTKVHDDDSKYDRKYDQNKNWEFNE